MEDKRKLIVPDIKRGQASVKSVKPVEHVAADAIDTISNEISRLRNRSYTKGLDLKEARVLSQLVDSVVKLSREERERTKEYDPSQLSEEELLKEFEKYVKAKESQGD